MASCRLTNSIKEEIRKAVLHYRFNEQVQTLIKDKAVFALKIYEDVFSKEERDLMSTLPNGWLAHEDDIRAQFGGSGNYVILDFNGTTEMDVFRKHFSFLYPNPVLKPLPFSLRYSCTKVYESNDKLTDEYEDLQERHDNLKEQVKRSVTQIQAALSSVTTVGALIKSWPEIEPFVPADALKPQGRNLLPTIPTHKLNTMLNLPKEEVEA